VCESAAPPTHEQLQLLLNRFGQNERRVLPPAGDLDAAAREEARRKRRIENKLFREEAERQRPAALAMKERKMKAAQRAKEAVEAILRQPNPRPFFGSFDPVHEDND